MISSAELGTRQLSMLVESAERIARLPAVVTQDWCSVASRYLMGIRPGSVCCVTVGREVPEGSGESRGLRVDLSGAASDAHGIGEASLGAIHTDGAKSIGWSFSDATSGHYAAGPSADGIESRVARLRDLPAWSSWPITTAGKRWSRLGVTELLVGRVTLEAADRTRAVYVEMGVPREQSVFTRVEAILLGTLLEPLRARVLSAFGSCEEAETQRITRREQAVLEELTLGRTVREIAERLDRSPHTVHDHVKALHRKLNANSRGELIARYLGFSLEEESGSDGAGSSVNGTSSTGREVRGNRISGEVTSG